MLIFDCRKQNNLVFYLQVSKIIRTFAADKLNNKLTSKSRKGTEIMATIRNFTESDILFAVATFNADPYCVENDEHVAEIMAEIEANGATMVTDADERKVVLAKLDIPDNSQRIVYQAGGCLFSMDDDEYTYDVVFNDDTDSNSKGFNSSFDYCKDYIRTYNGTNESYFEDYKGGTVQIVCNETEEVVYEEDVK